MKVGIGFPNPIMVLRASKNTARISYCYKIVEFGDFMAMMRALLKFYHARQRHS